MSVNEKLKELYRSKWQGLEKEMKKINSNPCHPLLLNIDEESYQKSKYKIIVFGQETYDWEGDFGNHNIEHLLGVYKGFSWQRMNGSFKGGRIFWQTLHQLINQWNNSNSPSYFIWNNIYKIGKAHEKGKPTDEIEEIENNHFNVIEEEVKILKPNVIIFFTGPGRDKNYDKKIKKVFGDFEHEGNSDIYKQDPIKKIIFANKNFDFIQSCYKAYHPIFLQINKKKDFVINTLCKNLF